MIAPAAVWCNAMLGRALAAYFLASSSAASVFAPIFLVGGGLFLRARRTTICLSPKGVKVQYVPVNRTGYLRERIS
jgi:hypothetical protein